MHGRSHNKEGLHRASLSSIAESEVNHLSDMDIGESTANTIRAPRNSDKTIGQAYDHSTTASSHQPAQLRKSAPLQVLQDELESLRAERLAVVSQLDEKISTLEGALKVLQRGS